MTDWPPTGGTGGTGSHPPAGGRTPTGQTSPSWSVSPTGSTPASPGGISPPSKKRPFGAGLSREARLAITIVAALLVIGLVIGLIFWATSGSDDSDDAVQPVVTTTTAAPATTIAPLPTVSVPPPPPPPPATTAAPITTTAAPGGYDPAALGPAVPPDVAGFPSQQAWAAMRECQTGGDYTAVSEEGTNYGAYQFRIATWDELAGREYPSLVGVVPSEASPADQDRMAYALWQEFGSSRWPGCRSTIDPTPPPTTAAPTAQQDAAAPTTAAPAEITPPTTQPGSPRQCLRLLISRLLPPRQPPRPPRQLLPRLQQPVCRQPLSGSSSASASRTATTPFAVPTASTTAPINSISAHGTMWPEGTLLFWWECCLRKHPSESRISWPRSSGTSAAGSLGQCAERDTCPKIRTYNQKP